MRGPGLGMKTLLRLSRGLGVYITELLSSAAITEIRVVVPLVQMGKLRHKEGKGLARGDLKDRWWSQDEILAHPPLVHAASLPAPGLGAVGEPGSKWGLTAHPWP